jgi:hypothetical protein
VASAFPSAEHEAAAKRDQEERDRQRLREERLELLQLADEAEAGVYGQLAVEAARRLLASGRTNFALSSLRSALRKLRVTSATARRGPSAPSPISKVRGAR